MAVLKVIEILANSDNSWEEAAKMLLRMRLNRLKILNQFILMSKVLPLRTERW
ncbi:hypothetical protein LCGC14_0634080 [marine sediment metagenome]|uniref:Uncharacterized protein n=1 Tax=marine sediment metagenome TaxID=412755 RepID=A0A0F9R6D9_9ZZZZ